jgi:hypothetical protein
VREKQANDVHGSWRLLLSGLLLQRAVGTLYQKVAVTRPFLDGRLNAGVNFLLAKGYTGQTTGTLALPGEGDPFERIVGVRQRSYAALSFTYRF